MRPLEPRQTLQRGGSPHAAVALAMTAPNRRLGRKLTLLFVMALTIMSGATISPALPAIEAHFAEAANAAL